jgi:hypothetical protein
MVVAEVAEPVAAGIGTCGGEDIGHERNPDGVRPITPGDAARFRRIRSA